MANADHRIRQLSDPAWHRLEQTVEDFERAWESGQRPVLDAYLTNGETLRPALLFELVAADLEYRLRAGEPARVEPYFDAYPDLRADDELAIDLIAAEFHGRRMSSVAAADECRGRFPEYEPELIKRMGKPAINAAALHSTPMPGETVSTADSAIAPPRIAGYEILDVLGRGGMGVVYRARQRALNRVVALKVIRAGSMADDALVSRFRTEAEVIARLQHPNIVQIHDVGPADDDSHLPFLAMEYVAGGSLADRLAETPMNSTDGAALVVILARATHAAHQAGVLHRDIKPANVLLTADGTPKIADFGLAKSLDEAGGPTLTGEVIGTPSYMAPEQAQGQAAQLGPPTDVYALGAILYEAITGFPPFRGSTALETLDQVRHRDPIPPRVVRPKLPRDLETICLKCLAKHPARRYASADALANDIDCFIAGRPILARPASAWERGWKWIKRHPASAAALAVSIAAIITITALAAGFTMRLRDERNLADKQRERAETSYRLAREAMDSGITKVRDDPRFARGDLADVRRVMMRAEADFYEQFAQLHGDDPAYQLERAEAFSRLGNITFHLGSHEKAIQYYRTSLDITRTLAAADPESADLRFRQAWILDRLGDLLQASRQFDAARLDLAEARTLVDGLLGEDPGNAKYRHTLIEVLAKNCVLNQRAGADRASIVSAFQQLEQMLIPLVSEYPKDPYYKWRLASVFALRSLGRRDPQRIPETEADLLKSLSLYEELVRDFPDKDDYVRDMSVALGNLAQGYRGTNRPELSVQTLLRMEALLEPLVRANPAKHWFRQLLAECNSGFGFSYTAMKKLTEAADAMRKCITLQEKLVTDDPSNVNYSRNLGKYHHKLGEILHTAGESEEAKRALDRAIDVLEDLNLRNPNFAQARESLFGSLCERGGILMHLGRYAEARLDYDRAVSFAPPNVELQLFLERAELLTRLCEHAEAFAEIESRSAGQKLNAKQLWQLSRIASLCCRAAGDDQALSVADRDALIDRYAAHAVQWLAEAKKAGYFKNDVNLKRLESDNDFALLRSRDDFRQLFP
jgi:eukaryotic-like serine/threonine-protein kinase